ncbi:Uncharacterised protein [Klebsiella pneumoniae subsp. ozaenae]|uniref:Uncharacterized protein n=1 Tax=Klebsiella pneumoniae subsp. ozaenae TaxID=574 RepID=A0A377Z9R6_KLEPO|nr:Uncharacterised protein [Klebsiella pneumoniae subsp. ozaenae]
MGLALEDGLAYQQGGCVMIHPFDIAVLEPGDEYAWRPDYGTLPQLTLVLRQVLNCENPR